MYAVYILIAGLMCAAAMAVLFTPTVFYAETATGSVELTPLGGKSEALSDTFYAYIPDANSVYADASGITVSCESNTVKFAAETFITTEKQFPSDKLYSVGGKDIVLYNGEVSLDGVTLSADGGVVDFDVYSDANGATVYALTADSIIKSTVTEDGFGSTETYAIVGIAGLKTIAVAASHDTVFVAYSSSALPKYKNAVGAYTFTDDDNSGIELDPILPQTDSVMSIAAFDDGATSLYVLTQFDISVYKMSTSGGIVVDDSYSTDNPELITISAYNGSEKCIYALDSLSGVIKVSGDLTLFKPIIASASDIDGFFNTPSGATVKHSTLYVADKVNGRIAEYGSELSYAPRTYVNPVSVASDSKNTLYVAHNRNTVTLSYIDGVSVDIKLPVEAGYINQIAVDTEKHLYILASRGMYRAEGCGDSSALPTLNKIENTSGYKAFSLSAGTENIYALSASGNAEKLKIDSNNGILSATALKSITVPNGTFSLAVDIEDNIFALTSSGLTRIDGATGKQTDYTFTVGTKPYSLISGQIVLNTVKNNFIRTDASDKTENETIYSNAIIVDSIKHRVFIADGASIDLKLIDGNYTPSGGLPESDTEPNPGGNGEANRIIRVALDDTPAFPIPVDMTSNYTIAKGRKVIVPVDQLNTPKEYLMVLIDDVATGKLIRRYVYKDTMSEPLPYSEPPEGATVATVYHNATPVYKWPSPNSQHVISAADKGKQLTLLNFVSSYTDDYGNKWFRVDIGNGSEGYVLASNVSLLDYEPTAIHPAYNATIIEYDGITSADVYRLDDDGNMVLWSDIPALPAGTRVEVLDAFNSSEQYTQIKFFNSEINGSLTCYVRTEHIDYDGVNVVLLIAILVTIVTLILIAVIVIRVIYTKKKRAVSTVYEQDDEDE